jgi:tetratricopeptide (TPR) repeat protein
MNVGKPYWLREYLLPVLVVGWLAHCPLPAAETEPAANLATHPAVKAAPEPTPEAPAPPATQSPTAKPVPETATTNNPVHSPAATAATDTNNPDADFKQPTRLDHFNYILATARFDASIHSYATAEKSYVKLLADDVPEDLRQTALFELGLTVQAQGDLPRAQSIFTQLLQHWPNIARTPEIYLHQGQIFRQMGLQNLALSKFYAVMTTALSLRNDQLPFYKGLVLQAQVEIAETHYLVGKFREASDYYSRLLAQDNPALDRPQIQFRYIRCLEAINQHDEAVKQALNFMQRYPESPELPEVRYHLAQGLKNQGRMPEALQQVLLFLKEEHSKTKDHPEVWSYWQQRVGNEIGNELYRQGDYVKALQVYLALSQLDASPDWQLPVRYQIGITYEKLLQPQLAMAVYHNILTNSAAGPATNASPNLKSVIEMAGWRLNYLEWEGRKTAFNAESTNALSGGTNLNLSQK